MSSLRTTSIVGLVILVLTACAGPYQSAVSMFTQRLQETTRPEALIAAPRDPNFSYLLVRSPSGHSAILALGFLDVSPEGTVQTWYSAGKETLQLVNGRVRLTQGLQIDRKFSRWPEGLPDVSSLMGPAPLSSGKVHRPISYLQTIDQAASGGLMQFSVSAREAIESEVPSEVLNATITSSADRRLWRWLREDSVIDQPDHPKHGQIIMTHWLAVSSGNWVYSHQCLVPGFCLSMRPLSTGSAQTVPK